jgi:type I restriction enzyme, S subunit
MKLKPYPTYKESHSNWLGLVPTGWKFSRHKFITSFTKGRNPPELLDDKLDGYLPYLSMDYLRGQSDPKYVSSDQSFCNVDDGQTLLLWDGANAGEFIHSKEGVLSSTVAWLKPKDTISGNFYWYYCKAVEHEVRRSSVGMGIPHVNGDELKTLIFPEPTFNEQSNIASFLDRETAKLDTLISKQEQLIELLQEKRQAIISHAVTKGLNPYATMKDSGLDWLGAVPSHWKITRLKYLGDAIIGLTYDPLEVVDEGEGTLILRSSNIQQGAACFEDNVFVKKDIPEKLKTKVGDILICSRNGSRKLIGKNITIDENTKNLSFGAFMTIFRTKYYKYISCVLNSSLFKFQAGSFLTSTVNQLTTGNLNSFEVPLPPEEEQIKIAEYINIQTNKIDTLIDKAKRSIDLAKEHRTALISAAVTGKIDVRNFESQLETA